MSPSAAYLRVSGKAQDFPTQRAAIERAAVARGDVIGTWYAEKKSGKSLAREELTRLRADARAGAVSKLFVFRLDRLTRSGIRDTLGLIEEFRAHGCEIVSVADGFDLAGPAAEIVLSVLSWAAKMERLAIGERISAARERIEAEGGAWGRPERLSPVDKANAIRLKAEGRTVREIAMSVKAPRSTVARWLASQKPSAEKSSAPRAP